MSSKKGAFLIPVILAIVLISIPTAYVVNKTLNKPKLIRPTSHQSNPGAKINMVTFVDYECPPCVTSHEVTKKVIAKNPDKFNLVIRHRIGEEHKNAELAAKAAEAAADQGQFFQMSDKLLENQSGWASLPNPQQTLTKYAQQLNLDTAKFQQDITSDKYLDRINKDEKDAKGFDVSTIPSTFIENTDISFTVPNSPEELEQQIARAESEIENLTREQKEKGTSDQLSIYLIIAIALGASIVLILLLHSAFFGAKEREKRIDYLQKKLMQFRQWRYFMPKKEK